MQLDGWPTLQCVLLLMTSEQILLFNKTIRTENWGSTGHFSYIGFPKVLLNKHLQQDKLHALFAIISASKKGDDSDKEPETEMTMISSVMEILKPLGLKHRKKDNRLKALEKKQGFPNCFSSQGDNLTKSDCTRLWWMKTLFVMKLGLKDFKERFIANAECHWLGQNMTSMNSCALFQTWQQKSFGNKTHTRHPKTRLTWDSVVFHSWGRFSLACSQLISTVSDQITLNVQLALFLYSVLFYSSLWPQGHWPTCRWSIVHSGTREDWAKGIWANLSPKLQSFLVHFKAYNFHLETLKSPVAFRLEQPWAPRACSKWWSPSLSSFKIPCPPEPELLAYALRGVPSAIVTHGWHVWPPLFACECSLRGTQRRWLRRC